jgi:hypothetical protein
VLGIDLPTSTVRHALTSLGFSCQWQPPEAYHVRVPYWRTDVRIPDDVAEEVARVIGYDEIPTKGLGGEIPPSIIEPRRALRESLRDALVAVDAGSDHILADDAGGAPAVVPEELAMHPPLRVESAERGYEYLRPVLGQLVKTLAANIRQHEGEIALPRRRACT